VRARKSRHAEQLQQEASGDLARITTYSRQTQEQMDRPVQTLEDLSHMVHVL